jgi:hypothetical protein
MNQMCWSWNLRFSRTSVGVSLVQQVGFSLISDKCVVNHVLPAVLSKCCYPPAAFFFVVVSFVFSLLFEIFQFFLSVIFQF